MDEWRKKYACYERERIRNYKYYGYARLMEIGGWRILRRGAWGLVGISCKGAGVLGEMGAIKDIERETIDWKLQSWGAWVRVNFVHIGARVEEQ